MKKIKLLNYLFVLLTVAVFMIASCGGGDSDAEDDQDLDTETQEEQGDLVISLTDAPGDFVCYTVDVLSLTLTRANGAQVTALPLETRIDFSQYTEMTEFLTIATIPSGVYVDATMTLDFADADIWVEDEDGDQVQVETILDTDGNAIDTIEMTVQLDDQNSLVIAPGVPAHLLLDFNLETANQVDFDDTGIPTLIVDPFMVADVNRTDIKLHRIRGLLNEVAVEDSSFSVYLRPFYCALTGAHGLFGLHTVVTTDDTAFDINGEQYVGEDGLVAMDDLTALTAVVAVGDLKFDPLRFEAREVYAGSSVPGGEFDAVQGSVVSRQDDTIVVKGATLIREDGTIIFNDQVTVEVGEDTTVTRQFPDDPDDTFNKDDISVGQRVVFLGELDDTDIMSLSMDATEGHARMLITVVRGTVKAIDEENPTAQLILDAQSINHRRVEDFDFSGTGDITENDAQPDNYEIYTGTMSLGTLDTEIPVKVRGFVQPFGDAPPDFNAQTIIDVADVRAFMKVNWIPASSEAFSEISADGLTLDLDNSWFFHHVIRGWVITDLTDLEQTPMVVPQEDGTGLFVIRYNTIVQASLDFEEFIDDLQGYLEDGAVVMSLHCVGEFDDSTVILQADSIDVQLRQSIIGSSQ